jgi:type IV pilus assembly protein PilY1
MRRIEIIALLVIVSIFFPFSVSHALDTDLYVLGARVPPNVLVILDSSASMDEVVSGSDADYNASLDYGFILSPPAVVYPRYAVYNKTAGGKWNLWVEDYQTLSSCPGLKTLLATYGHAENFDCGGGARDYQAGNYRNYLQIGGPGGTRSRFGLANGVLHSYIDTTAGVRFAVMAFNRDSNNNTVKYSFTNKSEYVFGDMRDDSLDANGGRLLGFVDEYKTGKTDIFNALASLKDDSWSPLAETLYEAGVYFQGGVSAITGTSYSGRSPVQYYCQRNYVLIISDGVPTKDNHSALSSFGGLAGVAKYLYEMDLSGGKYDKKQNIKTYTIGFSVNNPLMEETAKQGGGRYFYVYSSQSFEAALQIFITDVLEQSVSYVAPVVPISQMETFRSGNRMFLAMFKPTEKSFWKGNIKKFGIAEANDPSKEVLVGDVLDKNGNPAITSTNEINKEAVSYWSETADGGEVEAGGVGEVLLKRTTARKIYTYLGTNPELADSLNANAFIKENTSITPQKLGLASDDTTGRDNIIDFIHGLDVYDENRNGIYNEKREWILGAFIHSRPLVIHYSNLSVIYAGANDGMLHAFNNGWPLDAEKTNWHDGTGEELWAFIPPSLLPNLKNLSGTALQFFVDGPPKAYVERDSSGNLTKAVLIFGLRRGGDRYIALDVTDPYKPKWLWEISRSTSGYGELGQSWSSPILGKIKLATGEKWVAFIGGGYDTNQDNLPVTSNDAKGRGVYVIDISDGSLIWSYTRAKNTEMSYCIPSDLARVDVDGNGSIDRLYVGDMGGRIWRFDIGDPDPTKWTGKITFTCSPGSSDKRKIFYPPEVSLEIGNYEMVFFGSGDREHPKEANTLNRLYAVKDKNPSTPLSENNLVNVTSTVLQISDFETINGWYMDLVNTGEKCLSASALFYGVVYYTTFTPQFGNTGDPCFVSAGTARLYALNYKIGSAVLNLDGSLDGVISSSDRSKVIGISIPSGIIVTIINGQATAYVGVGGGVFRPPLPTARSLFPRNWKIRF